jgi:hypothetical protein
MTRTWRWSLAGFLAGGLLGVALLAADARQVAHGAPASGPIHPARAMDVLHTPPLLVSLGEPATLSYDIVCPLTGDAPGVPCKPTGTLNVRAVGGSGFLQVPLSIVKGVFSYAVPDILKGGTGFEYYATFQDGRGNTLTVPGGGAAAPEHAWIVPSFTTVDLGTHTFGTTRSPDAVLAQATWGAGPDQLGLNSGHEQSRIGPSGFDVSPDGTAVVLDQVNRRLAMYDGGTATHAPLDFVGGEGDIAVADDGTTWVLDDGGDRLPVPVIHSYTAAGTPVGSTELAAELGDMLRAGPNGPYVHTYPSEMWFPVGTATGQAQVESATSGRPVSGGRQLVVRASRQEVRLALVNGNQVVSAWRIRSGTYLGEVQMAEPTADGITAIVRLWTETQAEFHVLRLGAGGLLGSFDVPRAEWAESAPLSRFRLHGDTLYQLKTAPSGAEVVAYRMGGAR